MAKTTLALLKPDLVIQGFGDVIKEIEAEFEISGIKLVSLSKEDAEEFYQEHKSKDFFDRLVKQITSGPVLAMALTGDDAIWRWRDMMGPTDPVVAKKTAPDTLRARYGTELPNNATHGSDSEESAKKEIFFFFRKSF